MTRFEIVWKILTLPCSEAARLSSESLDHTISSYDGLAVRLHTLSCASCRRYRHQLLAIRRISTEAAERVDSPTPPLPEDVRNRIKRSLKGD